MLIQVIHQPYNLEAHHPRTEPETRRAVTAQFPDRVVHLHNLPHPEQKMVCNSCFFRNSAGGRAFHEDALFLNNQPVPLPLTSATTACNRPRPKPWTRNRCQRTPTT